MNSYLPLFFRIKNTCFVVSKLGYTIQIYRRYFFFIFHNIKTFNFVSQMIITILLVGHYNSKCMAD